MKVREFTPKYHNVGKTEIRDCLSFELCLLLGVCDIHANLESPHYTEKDIDVLPIHVRKKRRTMIITPQKDYRITSIDYDHIRTFIGLHYGLTYMHFLPEQKMIQIALKRKDCLPFFYDINTSYRRTL